jgi:hypothetical protein
MKKHFFYCVVFFFISVSAVAQQVYIDSFKRKANIINNDTLQLILLRNVARSYSELNPGQLFCLCGKSVESCPQTES